MLTQGALSLMRLSKNKKKAAEKIKKKAAEKKRDKITFTSKPKQIHYNRNFNTQIPTQSPIIVNLPAPEVFQANQDIVVEELYSKDNQNINNYSFKNDAKVIDRQKDENKERIQIEIPNEQKEIMENKQKQNTDINKKDLYKKKSKNCCYIY